MKNLLKNKSFPFKKLIFLTTGLGLLAFLLVTPSCSDQTKKSGSNKYASLDPGTRYAGMQECRQCHADIYETFSHTGMGLSFERASKKKSSATFTDNVIYDKFKNFYYQAVWKGDSLQCLEFRLEGKDTVYKRLQTIHYIVGSGQHTNSHIYNVNGYLHQAPVTFYTQEGRWDLPPGFENGGNSRFSRMIGLECMTCHNAYPDFVLGSENKYNVVKQGIDCERCHGPGQKHVDEKRKGILVNTEKEIDYSIVNPSKLPIDLQFDVCQRCHIQGNAVLNPGKSFFDFKPGMPLTEVMNVFMPLYKGQENEHIMASHAERLKMSRCFLDTQNKKPGTRGDKDLKPHLNSLTCITCHNPHVSVRKTDKAQFNKACLNCHSETTGNSCTESVMVLRQKEFNCVQCHMAGSPATDIPHVRVTDHLIRKPVPEREIQKIKHFTGIACINNPVAGARSKGNAFIAYYEKFNFDKSVLDSALKYFPLTTADEIRENFQELVHIFFLKKDYSRILNLIELSGNPMQFLKTKSFSNTDAWTCYRIAEAMKSAGRNSEAILYMERAVNLAPFNLEFQSFYGTLLAGANRIDEAKKVFQFVISENPASPQALSNLGYLLLAQQGDTAAASYYYKKALEFDPDYLQVQYNLAGLYIFRKQYENARRLLEGIQRRHPDEQDAEKILSSIRGLR